MNWIKEIYFQESTETCDSQSEEHDIYSGSSGLIVGSIQPWRFQLECTFCEAQGVCINCDFRQCNKTFHVRCAIENGLIRDVADMHRHKTDPYSERHEQMVRERAREERERERLEKIREEKCK